MSHTKEPWFCDEKGYIWRRHPNELYQNGGGVAGDKPLAICDKGWYGDGEQGYPNTENARRIVSCVNACAGIETKVLEKEHVIDYHKNARQERDTYRDLCAELLENMKKAMERIEDAFNKNNNAGLIITPCLIRDIGGAITKAESILGDKNGR